METHIQDKIKRFVELSGKFTVPLGYLFPDHQMQYTTGTIDCGTLYDRKYKNGSRGQEILSEAQVKATLSDEYDEYLQLQTDLTNYLNAAEKLK